MVVYRRWRGGLWRYICSGGGILERAKGVRFGGKYIVGVYSCGVKE